MDSTNRSKVIKKRKPVRRNPERRRQQNIEAQRKYRQKVRGKLQAFDQVSERKSANLPSADHVASSLPSSGFVLPDSGWQSILPTTYKPAEHECLSDPLLDGLMSSDVVLLSDNRPMISWDHLACPVHPDLIDSSSIFAPPSFAAHSSTFESSIQTRDDGETPSEYITSSSAPVQVTAESTLKIRTSSNFDCNCAGPHLQVQKLFDTRSDSYEIKILVLQPTAVTFDPYRNHIRLDTLCTVAAMEVLRAHVGITEEMVCIAESGSPFFRPIRQSANELTKDKLISTVQNIFETLKPDLRPTVEQILFDHPPYIDLLPFPTLRKNLILQKQPINKDQFLQDFAIGMSCWGGAGLGKRDRESLQRCTPTETPWDARNWEAEPWFLKTYWYLLGEEQGEVVKQSEWWRSIRGEEPLIPTGISI